MAKSACPPVSIVAMNRTELGWSLELDFPGGSDGRASACNTGDAGSIPGLGRPPGEGNGLLAWKIPRTEEPGRLQSMG